MWERFQGQVWGFGWGVSVLGCPPRHTHRMAMPAGEAAEVQRPAGPCPPHPLPAAAARLPFLGGGNMGCTPEECLY